MVRAEEEEKYQMKGRYSIILDEVEL